jgi:DNA modification methylase
MKLIINSSLRSRLVYEPSSGIGSTLIAADQLGRTFYSMELNPIYIVVIVTRWEEFKKIVKFQERLFKNSF